MVSRNNRIFLALLIVAIICTPLVGSVESENIEEEQMPYKQFSLVEVQESMVTRYPFGSVQTAEEEIEDPSSFEEWWIAKSQHQQITVPNLESIRAFTVNSARFIFLSDDGTNMLYSPINTWNYLALISHISKGSSRDQVMNLFGINSESNIAEENLYKALYWDDGNSICRPSSSIWVNQHIQLSEDFLSNIAAKCHMSVFQGPMGEDIFDVAFQSWLNTQTNGLLKEVVCDLGFDQNTTISLCTALYYRSSWSLPFNKDKTYTDVFYSVEGEKKVDFMTKEEGGASIYLGADFSSVIMDLQDGGYATFVLPDVNSNIKEILQSEELFDFLFSGVEWTAEKKGRVKISMPKVDALATTPLVDLFAHLGVTDIFDSFKAEFSNDIISNGNLELASVDQYSRLVLNEDGIEAASIIVSDSASFRIPNEEEIDFTLNRPFLFVVFSESNIPLFFGTYNTP